MSMDLFSVIVREFKWACKASATLPSISEFILLIFLMVCMSVFHAFLWLRCKHDRCMSLLGGSPNLMFGSGVHLIPKRGLWCVGRLVCSKCTIWLKWITQSVCFFYPSVWKFTILAFCSDLPWLASVFFLYYSLLRWSFRNNCQCFLGTGHMVVIRWSVYWAKWSYSTSWFRLIIAVRGLSFVWLAV